MKLINGKKGITLISYIMLIFCVISIIYIFVFLIFKFQITLEILRVRKDLFYISQNCLLSMDKELLAYNEYSINDNKMENIVKELLFRNYKNKVILDSISYDYDTNEVNIEVVLKMYPIISFGNIKQVNIPIKEKFKLKLLEVN